MPINQRRRHSLVTMTLALALGGCVATAPSLVVPSAPAGSPVPGRPSPSPAPSPSRVVGEPYAGAVARIPVASGPRGVASAGGSIWVASTIGNEVARVDPVTNLVVDRIQVARPVTVVTLSGELWVSVLNQDPEADDEIVQISTQSGKVTQRVAIPVFHNIAVGGGMLWAVDAEGQLRRVDPADGTVSSMGSVGGMTIGIAANDLAVWGIRSDGKAWRLPIVGGSLLEVDMGVLVPGRSRVAIGSVANSGLFVGVPGTVLVLDPTTLAKRTRLAIPGMTLVNDLWVGGDAVWLSANVVDKTLLLDGGSVLRLDPETARIRSTYRLGPESSGLVEIDGSLWAVDQRDNILARYPAGK